MFASPRVTLPVLLSVFIITENPLVVKGFFESFFILFDVGFDDFPCFNVDDFGFGNLVIVPHITDSYHVGGPFAVEHVGVASAVVRGGGDNLEHFCFPLFLFSD